MAPASRPGGKSYSTPFACGNRRCRTLHTQTLRGQARSEDAQYTAANHRNIYRVSPPPQQRRPQQVLKCRQQQRRPQQVLLKCRQQQRRPQQVLKCRQYSSRSTCSSGRILMKLTVRVQYGTGLHERRDERGQYCSGPHSRRTSSRTIRSVLP